MKKIFVIFLKIVLFFVGWAVLSGVADIPNDNSAIWRFFAEFIPFVVIVIFTIIFLMIEKKEVRIPIMQNSIKGILSGTMAGIIWIGFSATLLLVSNQMVIIEYNDVPLLGLWILSAFINVAMQEMLVRGYIYQLLKTRYNLSVAIFVTTAVFTLLHGGVFEAGIVPVVNVITMCLFTTALYESEGTILAPVMAHGIWNIIGAVVLGGVSLADDYPSVYEMVPSGSKLISGGDCKIEASILVTAINIILIFFFYFQYKKNILLKKQ